MSKVNIKGVILSENYFLDEGVTTLVDFQQEIGKCKDSIELEIDSQGGDVFTSNVMSTMLSDWCIRHPNAKCSCIVGGLCASAAANILAKLPACFKTECYEDTLIMYHSAYGVVEGSPETLRDNALLMDLVNSVVITKLLDKTTLDSERVHTAFKAGREMWLDGKEAVACGLVNEIRGVEADKSVLTAEYNDPSGDESYRYVAAIAKNIQSKLKNRKEITTMEEEKKETTEIVAEATTEINAEATTQIVAEAETTEEEKTEEAKAECDEKEPKAEAETEEEKTEAETEEEEEPKAEANVEVEALKAENATLKAEVESLKAVVAKYSVSAKAETVVTENKTFLQYMKEIPAGLSQSEYAKRFTALKNEHKAEYEAFMQSRQYRG